jgi:predicted nucleic acid-binding protein
MKRDVLAETGPLYAAADKDNSYHRKARSELKRLAREGYGVVVAYPTLCETYTLVLRRLGKPAASNWLDDMTTGASLINATAEDYQDARGKIEAFTDQLITLFDAIVAVLSQRLVMAVWFYVHHFILMRCAVWR